MILATVPGPKPRTGRFLAATIPASRSRYVETVTRDEQERPGTAGPDAWPIRLTRCGQHPGPTEANCTCGAPDVAQCDGCLACPGGAYDEMCGW